MTLLAREGAARGRPVRATRASTARTEAGFDCDVRVLAVVSLTHDTASFVLERPPGWTGRHEAGQHLVLRHGGDPGGTERCYTIASPPTRPDTLVVTVKHHPEGIVSPWLHRSVRPGDRLRVRGPYGEFTDRSHPAVPTAAHPGGAYLFLAAGSGITPAMSMTRALADDAADADVVLVYCVRTPADVVFRRELEALGAESGLSLRLVLVCEGDAPGERWAGPRGRLTRELLAGSAPDLADREAFVCGPPPFMETAGDLLDELGADPDRVHRESFTIEPPAPAPADAGSSPDTVRVELRTTGTVVSCPTDGTVLGAVERAGVLLRSSCRQGLCGTCKLTLLEGEVDMRHQGGIRPREIDQGKFLPCCSRPLTDLVLDA